MTQDATNKILGEFPTNSERKSTRRSRFESSRRSGGIDGSLGRKPMPAREVFSAIVYVLRTGCQGKALPKEFGSASAIHKHFQQWHRGVLSGAVAASAGRV